MKRIGRFWRFGKQYSIQSLVAGVWKFRKLCTIHYSFGGIGWFSKNAWYMVWFKKLVYFKINETLLETSFDEPITHFTKYKWKSLKDVYFESYGVNLKETKCSSPYINCWHFNIYWQVKFLAQLSWVWKKVLSPRSQILVAHEDQDLHWLQGKTSFSSARRGRWYLSHWNDREIFTHAFKAIVSVRRLCRVYPVNRNGSLPPVKIETATGRGQEKHADCLVSLQQGCQLLRASPQLSSNLGKVDVPQIQKQWPSMTEISLTRMLSLDSGDQSIIHCAQMS